MFLINIEATQRGVYLCTHTHTRRDIDLWSAPGQVASSTNQSGLGKLTNFPFIFAAAAFGIF